MAYRARAPADDVGRSGEWPKQASPDANTGTMGRLLLVDDDEQLRTLFSQALRMLGFAVDEESRLQTALARLEAAAAAYDCAVVDLGLPDGDGADLVRCLRHGHSRCSIIVLSEERLTPRRVLDLEEHALVLPKPLRIEELVEAIERRSPVRTVRAGAGTVADRFGLTKAERRILDSLNEDQIGTRADRARRLGYHPATYAKHLQNIFTKTNCHSAEELRLLLEQNAARERSNV